MIYVHIPFCKRKCYYCAFTSFSDNKIIDQYFNYLKKEIEERKTSKIVSSIYFGGGTPSCIEDKYICDTLNLIKQNYNLSSDCEITIECNPESVSLFKLKNYYKSGFNRISFGVQSLDEKALSKLGRYQTTNDVKNAILNAIKVGFNNISVDMLLGLENQSFTDLKKELKQLDEWGVEHISLYMLMIEDNTLLKNMVDKKLYNPLSDEICVKYYNKILAYLSSLGFERYEVSNFSKNKKMCRHNIGYWQLKDYLGFGLSAHSLISTNRLANPSNFKDYFKGMYQSENITEDMRVEEVIMLGLRTKFGVNEKYIKNKNNLNDLLKKSIVKKENANIVVCDKYYGVLNQIILKLI